MHVSGLEKFRNIWHNSLAMLSVIKGSKVTAIFFSTVAQLNSCFNKVTFFRDWAFNPFFIKRK